MSFKNFYDSNEYNLGRSHRAWRGRTHIRPCGHDSSKSSRATYESRRGVPLGDARSVLFCGYVGVLDWRRIWWFFPIAVGSYAFACLGYVAAKYRWQGWLRAHLAGQGGSYIAMVTALLVVNWETLTGTRGVMSPWAWVLPTVVGSPIIAWVTREVPLGRRPKL